MTALTDGDRVLGGRYRLGRLLGRGAMAAVYDGVDTRLERAVAVKVLGGDSALGPEGRIRFEREARAAARLTHPHVVAIYDSGTDGDIAYIVMERLPGTTLADYMQGGPLAADWVLHVATDVLDALGAAHSVGLTHRDIKPGNILITPDDRAKVADFGIAKLADIDADADLTATGLVVGTAAYLPPERIDGKPASARGDLYALGVVLYEALAGRKPFTGDSPVSVAYAARHGQPPALGRLRPDLSPSLVSAVARAMAVDPDARFGDAEEMAAALRAAGAPSRLADPASASTERLDVSAAPTELLARRAGSAPTALVQAGRSAVTAWYRRDRRRTALLAAASLFAVAVGVAALTGSQKGAPASTRSPATARSPGTTASTATGPATTPAAATTTTTSSVAASASDPQAAALEAAAVKLASSDGADPQAAALLQQVASLSPTLRPAAAAAAETALAGMLASGRLTNPQYQLAMAPLVAITGGGVPVGAPPGPAKNAHGSGKHDG